MTSQSNLEFTGVAEVLDGWNGHLGSLIATPPTSPIWNCCSCLPPMPRNSAGYILSWNIGSAFAMTEPYEASSDPSNLTTRISRDGDQYVINGRKWFASNASHANCELFGSGCNRPRSISLQTSVISARATQHPRGRDGPRLAGIRSSVANEYPSGIHPHRCSRAGSQPARRAGRGLSSRPARLHHCMRAIGECEVLISLMILRSQERSTFGKRIDEYSSGNKLFSHRTRPMPITGTASSPSTRHRGQQSGAKTDFYDQSRSRE